MHVYYYGKLHQSSKDFNKFQCFIFWAKFHTMEIKGKSSPHTKSRKDLFGKIVPKWPYFDGKRPEVIIFYTIKFPGQLNFIYFAVWPIDQPNWFFPLVNDCQSAYLTKLEKNPDYNLLSRGLITFIQKWLSVQNEVLFTNWK
jgi:hypothetical protein